MSKRNDCRMCGGKNISRFLQLSDMPRAGAYLKKEDLEKPEILYPLDIYFCKDCFSVQLIDIIPRETLFDDYRYLSSVASKSVLEHFESYADEINNLLTKKSNLVVEIACNDGILLKPLSEHQINCLGDDPASNRVSVAKEKGLNVVNDFFGKDLAKKITKEYGNAEIIVANAVFAHIDDMDDMTDGITELLSNSGTFIFEVHHLVDIIEDMQYDSFSHEHFSYHSIMTLSKFLKKYEMEICDVKKFTVRGGMIRVYAKKINNNNKINSSVTEFINQEKIFLVFYNYLICQELVDI